MAQRGTADVPQRCRHLFRPHPGPRHDHRLLQRRVLPGGDGADGCGVHHGIPVRHRRGGTVAGVTPWGFGGSRRATSTAPPPICPAAAPNVYAAPPESPPAGPLRSATYSARTPTPGGSRNRRSSSRVCHIRHPTICDTRRPVSLCRLAPMSKRCRGCSATLGGVRVRDGAKLITSARAERRRRIRRRERRRHTVTVRVRSIA